MCLKSDEWMVSSVDPEQTVPKGVWSGSPLFAQWILFEHLKKPHMHSTVLSTEFISEVLCVCVWQFYNKSSVKNL